MDRVLKARLGVARILLQQQSGQPGHKTVSAIQSKALSEAIRATELDAGGLSDVCEAVMQLPWHGQDLQGLLAELDKRVEAKRPPTRRSLQCYLAITSYADAGTMEVLNNPSPMSDDKLATILGLALALGLRCPTEPTLKLLCSWWLMTTADWDRATRQHKQVMLLHVKSTWDRLRKLCSAPAAWIDRLPASPAELLATYPAVYKGYYVHGSPQPLAPAFILRLREVDRSYTCRGTLRPEASSSPGGEPVSAMERMMCMLMDKVQPPKQPVITMCDSDIRSKHGPQSLLALMGCEVPGRHAQNVRRLPTTQLPETQEDSAEATPSPATRTSPGATSPVTLALTSGVDASSTALVESPTPDADLRRQAAAPPEYPGGVAGTVGAIVSMLESRRREKPATKAFKRPAAAGADAPIEDAPASPKLPAKTVQKKGPKAAAKAEEETNVACQPAREATAKADTAPEQAALLLGCAKCRGCWTGCTQCRNPNFGGKRFQR